MCREEIQSRVDEITDKIEKQDKVVEEISGRIEEYDGNELGVNDEWKNFERTAWLKKFVDEDITLLDLRLRRMELQADKFSE